MRTPTPGPITIALVAVLAGVSLFATTSVTVVEGDTLSSIAARHGVSTADLVAWNEIDDPDRIFVGEVIVLAAPPADGASGQPVEHVVSAGDTLSVIAARYGASIAAIAEQNGLDDVDVIRIGQRLSIGGDGPPSQAVDVADPSDRPIEAQTTHTVAAGDTLFSIARRYQRTVTAIAAENGIADTDRITVGDVLTIPGADPAPDMTDEPDTTDPAPDPSASADEESEEEPDAAPVDLPDESSPNDGADEQPTRGAAPDPEASAADLVDAFALWSTVYGVEQELLEAIAWYASDWDPTRTGLDDRIGIAQMTPGQIELVETRLIGRDLDPFDGPDGVRLAARYLRYVQDRTDSESAALMAFRQGLRSYRDDGPTADAEAFSLAVADIRDQRG